MAKKKRKKKKKLSAIEKQQRRTQRKFYREFRATFRDLGFARVKADGIEITLSGRTGELDDIFIFQNVIVIAEYTIGKPDSSHVLKKKPLFDRIIADVPWFLQTARTFYPDLSQHLDGMYADTHYKVRIMYVSLHDQSPETIATCPDIIFIDSGLRKYFYALARTIEQSARVEFLSYLKLEWKDVGPVVLSSSTLTREYAGQLLPDSMSSYPKGFKIVSFYADPETLIAGAYVLRRDGWRDSSHLYQRILIRGKIAKMRRYLVDYGRVFVNNVIVTLPSKTSLKPLEGGGSLSGQDLNKATPITVSLPVTHNAVGIIDGQHRVFCYHEGRDAYEKQISMLRKRQHLLVTGIVYPENISEKARLEFEARLFLEINDTQTRARPALRQDIETIVRPFSGIAVARRVISEMARRGPYAGKFQLAYFDATTKIKTSSIVSYGLRPLVKFDGADSLFSAWKNKNKTRLASREGKTTRGTGYEEDLKLLDAYVEFCVKSINDFLIAAKLNFGPGDWDLDSDKPSLLLRPTSINGLIACLRRIIEQDLSLAQEVHSKKLAGLSSFKFGSYKSSAWDSLGKALFEEYYSGSSA